MRPSGHPAIIKRGSEHRAMIKRHGDHPAIIKRLRRADGHLQKIIEMIGSGRSCLQIAQQLQAVEGAIENAKKALIHDHYSHCLNRSVNVPGTAGRAAMRRFKLIARYL
jgi:hypothetical protein NreA